MEKKSKKSLIIGITSLFLVTLLLLGLTYAYYRTRIIGNNSNEPSISVTSKKLGVSYEDGNAVLSSEGNIEPGFTATKQFSVQNTGDETTTFSIFLDNVINEFNKGINERGEYNDWKYYLYSGNEENESSLIKEGEITTESTQYLLESVSINVSETKQYLLKVEYEHLEDVDQSLDMGSKFSIRVNIGDEYTNANPFTEGTLAYAILRDNVVSEPKTTPGQSASAADEAILSITEDDYGISYYFRGNVQNNYVNYSGMCWRIVRVQGNGTIKLALVDENGECNADTFSVNNYSGMIIDGRTDFRYKSVVESNESNSLLFENSDIPAILSNWAEKKNLDMSKIVKTEWCNDTTKTSIIAPDWITSHYGARDRILNGNPTLKCNLVGMEGTTGVEASATIYKNELGILSADEVAFAGGSMENYYVHNYYLQGGIDEENDSKEYHYYTMTPSHVEENVFPFIYNVNFGFGTVDVGEYYLYTSGVRPAVALQSDILLDSTITGQDGTFDKPYVIG